MVSFLSFTAEQTIFITGRALYDRSAVGIIEGLIRLLNALTPLLREGGIGCDLGGSVLLFALADCCVKPTAGINADQNNIDLRLSIKSDESTGY